MTLLRRARNNLWLLGACRDWRTLRAMKSRAEGGAQGPQTLRFRGLDAPVLYRPDSTDIAVAWELFRGREYDCTLGWEFKSVVDCGANVGMFLAFVVMRLRGRPFRYAGVEADPEAFAMLERQVAGLGVGACSRLIHAAAWSHDGEVRFDDQGPSWARHVMASGGKCVRAATIESLLDEAGLPECDLLKLDIEGGERVVLPRMKSWGARVRVVVAELHDGLDYRWFAAIAEDAGFEPFAPGQLFRSHPGAIRRDVARDLMKRSLPRQRAFRGTANGP
jgi:FkbM family methyltransferase